MCAIFAFVPRQLPDGRLADPSAKTLRAIVRANASRGPHAFGLAWVDRHGRLRMYKQTGRLVDDLGILAMTRGCRLLIGHLRYATHGDARVPSNNHPHPVDGGWLVHNGVIRNHATLAEHHELYPTTACDSEVLGLLAETVDVDLHGRAATRLERLAAAAELCDGPLAALAVWSRPGALVAVRRGNPLHWSSAAEGLYLATVASGLPGKATLLPDNAGWRFQTSGRKITSTAVALAPPAVPHRSWSAGGAYRGG